MGEVLDAYRYRTTAGRTQGEAMCLGGGGSSARAAAGSQGMAGATLPDSNADTLAREDLSKLYVGATRKNRVSNSDHSYRNSEFSLLRDLAGDRFIGNFHLPNGRSPVTS